MSVNNISGAKNCVKQGRFVEVRVRTRFDNAGASLAKDRGHHLDLAVGIRKYLDRHFRADIN